jgi:hypothetical protein
VANLEDLPQSLVQKIEDATGASKLPVTVWIGSDGLVRQVRETTDTKTGGKSLASTVTIDVSDYGTDVSVSAPPFAQVLDLTDLAASALQQATSSQSAAASISG